MAQERIETPRWDLSEWPDLVYEPSEDSFLLLDTLEEELNFIRSLHPVNILEIGAGSGIIISAMAQAFKNSNCIAVDINPFACLATQKTASSNGVIVNVVQSDLSSGLRLAGGVDLLLFNPPYVPSSGEEGSGLLDQAWAGSLRGRAATDRLFPQLAELMSARSAGYLVALEENDPLEMCSILRSAGFHTSIAKKRKVPGERLSVIKFSRGKA